MPVILSLSSCKITLLISQQKLSSTRDISGRRESLRHGVFSCTFFFFLATGRRAKKMGAGGGVGGAEKGREPSERENSGSLQATCNTMQSLVVSLLRVIYNVPITDTYQLMYLCCITVASACVVVCVLSGKWGYVDVGVYCRGKGGGRVRHLGLCFVLW